MFALLFKQFTAICAWPTGTSILRSAAIGQFWKIAVLPRPATPGKKAIKITLLIFILAKNWWGGMKQRLSRRGSDSVRSIVFHPGTAGNSAISLYILSREAANGLGPRHLPGAKAVRDAGSGLKHPHQATRKSATGDLTRGIAIRNTGLQHRPHQAASLGGSVYSAGAVGARDGRRIKGRPHQAADIRRPDYNAHAVGFGDGTKQIIPHQAADHIMPSHTAMVIA